jgi:hypothetical protein
MFATYRHSCIYPSPHAALQIRNIRMAFESQINGGAQAAFAAKASKHKGTTARQFLPSSLELCVWKIIQIYLSGIGAGLNFGRLPNIHEQESSGTHTDESDRGQKPNASMWLYVHAVITRERPFSCENLRKRFELS